MRRRGEINGLKYRKVGYSIRHLSDEYRVIINGEAVFVYADTFKEFKQKMQDLTGIEGDEESKIQVRPLQSAGKAGPEPDDQREGPKLLQPDLQR